MNPFYLKIHRLHPKGIKLTKAEKTLNETAHPQGVKFCKAFSSINACGWWIYPPIDIDITWKGGKEFSYEYLEPWSNSEHELVKSLVKDSDNVDIDKFCPIQGRSKFTFGGVEENIVQIWTGCIFQTPPGWNLQIRSPINLDTPDYKIMEGNLETDWMQYDIWINVALQTKNKKIELRKNQWPPLAQIIPIRRETTEANWEITEDQLVNRQTPEAEAVFNYWIQYNQQKFGNGGKQYLSEDRTKDSTTFFKERSKLLNKETFEPHPQEIKHPISSKPKKIKNKLIRKKNVHSPSPNPGIPTPTACPFSGNHPTNI